MDDFKKNKSKVIPLHQASDIPPTLKEPAKEDHYQTFLDIAKKAIPKNTTPNACPCSKHIDRLAEEIRLLRQEVQFSIKKLSAEIIKKLFANTKSLVSISAI